MEISELPEQRALRLTKELIRLGCTPDKAAEEARKFVALSIASSRGSTAKHVTPKKPLPETEELLAYLSDRSVVTTPEILKEVFKTELTGQTRALLMQVAGFLREKGWKKSFDWHDGKRQKIWSAP